MKILLTIFDSVGEWLFQEFLKRYPDSFAHKLMNNGIYFSNNYTASCYSYPSYPSILMGCYPFEHGILGKIGFKCKKKIETIHDFAIKNGYETYSYSDHEWLFNGNYGYNINCLNTSELDLNKTYPDNSFIFLNFWNTHEPFMEWKDVLEGNPLRKPDIVDMRQAYNENNQQWIEEIRENWIQRCCIKMAQNFDVLEKIHEVNPDLKIIFTSDHGDDYCYNGIPTHGGELYDTIAKVPLLIYGFPKRETNQLYSSVFIKSIIKGLIKDGENTVISHPKKVYLTSEDIKPLIHIIGVKYQSGDKYMIYCKGPSFACNSYMFTYDKHRHEKYQSFSLETKLFKELSIQYPYLFDEKLFGEYVKRASINKQ